jgi:hypothetical protein
MRSLTRESINFYATQYSTARKNKCPTQAIPLPHNKIPKNMHPGRSFRSATNLEVYARTATSTSPGSDLGHIKLRHKR